MQKCKKKLWKKEKGFGFQENFTIPKIINKKSFWFPKKFTIS